MKNMHEIIDKVKNEFPEKIEQTWDIVKQKFADVADIIEEHPRASRLAFAAGMLACLAHHDSMEHDYRTELTTKHIHYRSERNNRFKDE